jgi:redox-sensitive bicupin YhaK (pirin superfamily)
VITIRPAAERGRTNWGWLDSRHAFSFGEYYDPRHMGYLLQIWIVPDARGLAPRYDQRAVDADAARRRFVQLASGAPSNGSP